MGLALGNALHLRGMQAVDLALGEPLLGEDPELLAAEELPVGVLHPAANSLLIRDPLEVLEVMEPGHQPDGDSGSAIVGAVERSNSAARSSQGITPASRTSSWSMSKARSRRMVAIRGCSWVLGLAFGYIGTPDLAGLSLPFWCTAYEISSRKNAPRLTFQGFSGRTIESLFMLSRGSIAGEGGTPEGTTPMTSSSQPDKLYRFKMSIEGLEYSD